jgi:polysaccharide chain length determinant protein (PEP-CTERM system associated)
MVLPPQKSTFAAAMSPLSIVRMLWKRKITIVLIWSIVSAIAYFVVKRIPAMYKADTLILVDSQKIPDKYVASTVVTDAQDRLASISQQILSAGRLEKIVEDFDLYREERKTRFKEDIISMMRRDIETTLERNWNGRTASFRITYQGRDAAVVAQVVNKIANLFVEENLKTRESQAAGTTEFIESQLKEAKQKLDELEAAVSHYKLSHNGELPQQETAISGILNRLGIALEANRDAINRAQQQKVMLQNSLSVAEDSEARQVSELRAAANQAPDSPYSAPASDVTEPKPQKRSEQIEAQLAELRIRYSESHPDIKRLRLLLEQVRQSEERARGESAAATSATIVAKTLPTNRPAPQKPSTNLTSSALAQTRERIAAFKSQLEMINQEIETRKREQQRILSDIAVYQARMNGLPIREQEMAGLTRDYEISKANYRSLLDKKIAAEMATDMERREKSERFAIIDPARVPAKSFKPNRKLLFLGGSVFGLLLGLALAVGAEVNEGTLLGEWELPTGTTVLGRLPYIEIVPHASDETIPLVGGKGNLS